MGIVDYPIGKLRIKVNLRQLLDGYESVEARHRQRHSDKWGDREPWDHGLPGGLDWEANRKPAIPQERSKLRQFVLDLPDPQVDAVIFNLDPPKGNVPPNTSPKSERVTALFEWLESSIGPGLAALRSALAKVL